MTQNQIAFAKYQEEVRTNTANEAIRRRANEISDYANTLKEQGLYTDRINAETNRMQAENKQRETEYNYILGVQRLANEANIAQAQLAQQASIESARQAETARHNAATEAEAIKGRETGQQIASTQTRAGILNNLLGLAGKLIPLASK